MAKKTQPKVNYSKWFAAAALLVVAALVYSNLVPPAPAALSASSAKGAAPQFTLTDIEGRALSLAQYRGKVVILDFWAPWCPPCRKEIPDFISLQHQYALQGLQVIGIGLDEPSKVAAFVQENGINYPVAAGDDAISNLYGGVSGIPTTFIIDRQGVIKNRFEGFTERSVFEAEIRKLL